MKRLEKVLAILLILGMVFSVVACNNGSSEATPTPDNSGTTTPDNSGAATPDTGNTSVKDTLTVVFTQDRGTLDPMYVLGYDLLNGLRQIYDTLWDIDADGNMVWILATGITYVEPTKWHIHLREGVNFENGNPFTAEDALFSILKGNQRVGEPQYLPELDMELSNVYDEYTVELIFNAYDLSYVAGMTSLVMFDVESFDEEKIATTPMGTGPYVLSEYVINSHMTLTLREDGGYWGEMPKIKTLKFIILAEDAQRVNALQTGTADISGVPFQDIEYVQSLPGVTVHLRSTGASSGLWFNTSKDSVFYDNADARKAVAMGVDRQAIADIAYSGFATVSRLPMATGNVDVEDRFMDLGVYGIGYDPVQAKALAESSGLVGKEILLINPGYSETVVICELIQANMKEIGVNVNVQSLDAGSWLTYVFDPSMYDMCISMISVPSLTMAQNYYAWTMFMIGGTYVTDPWPGRDRFLELIDGIMAVSDPAELSERYMELTEIHLDAMLWLSLVDTQIAYAYNSDLLGWAPMLAGNVNYAKLSWAA